MMKIAGLTEPTVKEWEKLKDRIHTVTGKESQAQVPRMFHLILQRVKTIISLFEKVYRSSSKFFLLILAS